MAADGPVITDRAGTVIRIERSDQAQNFFGMLELYYRVIFSDLSAFIAAGRPGEPIDANTNIISYWPPETIRARFQAACCAQSVSEQIIIDLQHIGREGRLRLIAQAAPLIGLTPAGRHRVETLERESYETEIGRTWLLACISGDTEALRRLGVTP